MSLSASSVATDPSTATEPTAARNRLVLVVYTAAKSAILGLTRSLARDYGQYNIRVNAIAPGWIMTERQVEKWLTPQGEADLMKAQCLKRKLYPDDIAKVVVFLASEEAGAITSQQSVVDGGRL